MNRKKPSAMLKELTEVFRSVPDTRNYRELYLDKCKTIVNQYQLDHTIIDNLQHIQNIVIVGLGYGEIAYQILKNNSLVNVYGVCEYNNNINDFCVCQNEYEALKFNIETQIFNIYERFTLCKSINEVDLDKIDLIVIDLKYQSNKQKQIVFPEHIKVLHI
jgi:hypothetical protein